MKISKEELIALGTIIVYIAFFTHPVPHFIAGILSTPIGHGVILVLALYVLAYQSLIVGIFLLMAYIMSTPGTLEYMDSKEQTPKKQEKKVSASGIPPPAITGALANSLMKGDVRLPQKEGKSQTEAPKTSISPKPSLAPNVEKFSQF